MARSRAKGPQGPANEPTPDPPEVRDEVLKELAQNPPPDPSGDHGETIAASSTTPDASPTILDAEGNPLPPSPVESAPPPIVPSGPNANVHRGMVTSQTPPATLQIGNVTLDDGTLAEAELAIAAMDLTPEQVDQIIREVMGDPAEPTENQKLEDQRRIEDARRIQAIPLSETPRTEVEMRRQSKERLARLGLDRG